MTLLDRHIGAVRTRMTLTLWLKTLARIGMVFAGIVAVAILVDRIFQLHLPHQIIWFWAGAGITAVGSLVYALWQRPSLNRAAVAIDDALRLKEKFSTALFVRSSADPFAIATVRDAEQTAHKVNLADKLPIRLPKEAIGTGAAIALVFLIAWLFPTIYLGATPTQQAQAKQAEIEKQRQAREVVLKAIAQIESAPKAIAEKPEIVLAKRELEGLRGKPTLDPERAKGTGQKAMEDLQKAMQEKIAENKQFATQQEEARQFKNVAPDAGDTGPIADAARAMAQGKLDQAVEDLDKAIKDFDKMSPKDQEKAAEQAKALAKAIQKMANDPNVQKNVANQLQKMGANQQQMQQVQNLMQQAAAGNRQAQQQLNQIAKQLAQQMNQNGNMTPQQQRAAAQQVQKSMQQMQQQMNGQMNAQQLAGAAQALAQAMQQAAQGGNAGQPKQGNSSQMANVKNGNPPNQQPGKGNPSQKQQMTNAGKQMQNQLQQMQAVAKDAQQVAAGQDGAGDGQGADDGQQADSGQNGNPNDGNGQGQNGQNGGNNNNNQGQANGQGGGMANGNNRPAPAESAFTLKNELDSKQKDEKGKVLASNFVRAGSIKGDAKLQLHDVLPAMDKDATDEVGEQRIPRQDQDVVRGYFGNLERDSK
jgi:hypothetical protein